MRHPTRPALPTRLTRAPRAWALAVALVTALLTIPLVVMEPTSTASPEPDGRVFDARNTINDRFEIAEYPVFVIVEPDGGEGDMLEPARLRELAAAQEAVRTDGTVGDLLLRSVDRETGQRIDGVFSVADAVESARGAGHVPRRGR